MFKNIGKKIKSLAKIIFWIEAIIFAITGIVTIISGITGQYAYYNGYSKSNGMVVFEGFLILVLGILAAWVSSFFTYGFGELIDNVSDIKKTISNNGGNVSGNQPAPTAAQPAIPAASVPTQDENKETDIYGI